MAHIGKILSGEWRGRVLRFGKTARIGSHTSCSSSYQPFNTLTNKYVYKTDIIDETIWQMQKYTPITCTKLQTHSSILSHLFKVYFIQFCIYRARSWLVATKEKTQHCRLKTKHLEYHMELPLLRVMCSTLDHKLKNPLSFMKKCYDTIWHVKDCLSQLT